MQSKPERLPAEHGSGAKFAVGGILLHAAISRKSSGSAGECFFYLQVANRHFCSEEFKKVCEEQELLNAGGETNKVEFAETAVDRGNLQGYESTQAGTVEELKVCEVEDDMSASLDHRLNQRADLGGIFADDFAVAPDGRSKPSALVGGFVDCVVEGFKCHRAVSPLE